MYKKVPFPIVSLKLGKTKKKEVKSPDPRNNPFQIIQNIQEEKFNSLSPRSGKLPRLRAISPSFDFKNKKVSKAKKLNIHPSPVISLQLFNKQHYASPGERTPTFSQFD